MGDQVRDRLWFALIVMCVLGALSRLTLYGPIGWGGAIDAAIVCAGIVAILAYLALAWLDRE